VLGGTAPRRRARAGRDQVRVFNNEIRPHGG
jgi:hypothetical protein